MSLPEKFRMEAPFPQRNLIVFLTFSVILVTLVLQGLTLPPLIRALGLTGAQGNKNEEEDARRIITTAALAHLEEIRGKDEPGFEEVYDDVAHHYSQRLAILNQDGAGGDAMSLKELGRYREVTAELMRVERKTAVRLRNEGRISDEVLRKIEHELDLSETRLALS